MFRIHARKYLDRVYIHKLDADDLSLLQQAAIWAEKKWNYIAAYGRSEQLNADACLEARKKLIGELLAEPHGFYMIMMTILGQEQPVGMFSLRSWEHKATIPALQKVVELDYVYIDENFRNLGLGGQIIVEACEAAKANGFDTMILDTLNPTLNRFYQAYGAQFLHESAYNTFPTEKLYIDLQKPLKVPGRSSPAISQASFQEEQKSFTP